jgi:hypothetical protein
MFVGYIPVVFISFFLVYVCSEMKKYISEDFSTAVIGYWLK